MKRTIPEIESLSRKMLKSSIITEIDGKTSIRNAKLECGEDRSSNAILGVENVVMK